VGVLPLAIVTQGQIVRHLFERHFGSFFELPVSV
jgi:hypothetical protein